MKLAVVLEHHVFFRQNGYIEFEELISPRLLEELKEQIKNSLNKKIEKNPSPEKFFLEGRDLWRENESLKKIIFQPSFATIAAELVAQRPLRIAYDQFFPELTSRTTLYKNFVSTPRSLNEFSSLDGIACGMLLCLSQKENSSYPTLLKPGNALFFRADCPMDFNELVQRPNSSYHMIAYSKERSIYEKQDIDPHAYAFKDLGYSFGERLSDKLNPILCR